MEREILWIDSMKERSHAYVDTKRFPSNQRFRNFRKWYGNFLGKFPENLKTVEQAILQLCG